jgi:general secretion pathway protein M
MKIFNLPSFSLKSIKAIQLPFNINLQRREKIALTAAGAVLVLFLFLELVIFPVVNRGDALRSQIKSKTRALQEMQALRTEYQSNSRYSRDMEASLKQRPKTFTLFSFVDKLAGTSGVKSNVVYMKPSTSNLKNSTYTLSTVEIKLTALTMEQLTAFIYGLEDSANMVWIRRISLTKGEKNENLLNSVLQVETFQL